MMFFPVRTFVLALALTLCLVATQSVDAAPATLAGLMVEVVNPAANTLWSARGKDTLSDKDWDDIKQAAATLRTASATISAGGSMPNDRALPASAAWSEWSSQFMATVETAMRASDREDRQALVMAGNTLVDVCQGCHTAIALPAR